MGQEEVSERADDDGDHIRKEDTDVERMNEQTHEEEISDQGDQAVGQVKADQSTRNGGGVTAIAPGMVPVPHKVMNECELKRGSGGEQIVVMPGAVEQMQRRQLHRHTEQADKMKAEPATEGAHARGSSL